MKSVECPHCKNHDIVTSRIPKDVVAVVPCAGCRELVVVFRNKVMALNRDIMENGTIDDRKAHIASIIVEFLEPEMLSFGLNRIMHNNMRNFIEERPKESTDRPISPDEIKKFRLEELDKIDDPSYFKEHFC